MNPIPSLLAHAPTEWTKKDDGHIIEYTALIKHPEHGVCRYTTWRRKVGTVPFACILYQHGQRLIQSKRFTQSEIDTLWNSARGST